MPSGEFVTNRADLTNEDGTINTGKIYQGGAMRLLSYLPHSSVDAVITHPPNDLNTFTDEDEFTLHESNTWQYQRWLGKWLGECCRVLKPRGSLFLMTTPVRAFDVYAVLAAEGLEVRHAIVWDANTDFRENGFVVRNHTIIHAVKYKDKAAFYPILMPHPRHKDGTLMFPQLWDGHPFGIDPGDVWTDLKPAPLVSGANPFSFSLPVVERMILAGTREQDIILDPFTLSMGRVGIAALRMGRRFLGFEWRSFLIDIANAALQGAEPTKLAGRFVSYQGTRPATLRLGEWEAIAAVYETPSVHRLHQRRLKLLTEIGGI